MKQNAIHAEMVALTFTDGTELEMPHAAYSGSLYELTNAHGRIERIHYKPGSEAELALILQKERITSAVRRRPSRKKKPAPR